MNDRRVKIGVIVILIGIFFVFTAYMNLQELENNIFVESNSYTKGIGLLNRYIKGIGIMISIIGIGYTSIGLITDKQISNSSVANKEQ